MSLLDRYFGRADADAAVDVEQAKERAAAIRSLVSAYGFRTELVDWIDREIALRRVKPGMHENMLYEVGLMDGLEIVRQRLRAMMDMARDG
jgi:hypothetical protein